MSVTTYVPTLLASSAAQLGSQKMILFAAVVVVALCAGSVRLLTFDRYYPVDDYVDEPTYVALANDERGLSDQTVLRNTFGTLAPLYVSVSVVVQNIYDAVKNYPWQIPGEYLYIMRALSAVFGVLTALIMTWLGWQLAGANAGLLSGLIWSLSPVVVAFNSLAIPDPMLYLICVLGVGAGLFAWKRHSFPLLIVSLLCGVMAIYIKLWIATALLPFMMASFLLARADRRWLKRVALLYVIGIGFAAHFLLVIQPFTNTNKIQRNVADGAFFNNLLNLNRVSNNFWYMIYPTDQGIGIVYVVLALGVASYFYCRRQKVRVVSGAALLFVAVCIVGNWWLSAGISNVNIDSAGRVRHIFPASVSFIPLWAALLVQIGWAARHWFSRRGRPLKWLPGGVTAVILLVLLPGFIVNDAQQVTDFSREHVLLRTMSWFDNTPPHDGIVLSPAGSAINNLWNRFWGLYIGSKPYNEWFDPLATIIETRPASYLERNISWLVMDSRDIARAKNPTALQDYLKQLLLVKTIPGDMPSVQGRTVYIYRFAPPDYPVDFTFGDVMKLVGYDLSATRLKPGEDITFRPYWKLMKPFAQNLSLYFHLYSAASLDAGSPELLAQFDTTPMHNTDFPTSLWKDTDEIYLGDRFVFTIPAELPSGNYVLALGLYDYSSGARLQGQDGNTYYGVDVKVS